MNIHNNNIIKRFIVMICIMALCSLTFADCICYAERAPRLNVKSLSLVKGKSYKVRVYNTSSDHTISFESSNPEIAFIKSYKKNSCNIKAKSSGQATITAYITNNTTEVVTELKCNVTITPPAVTVKFCKKKIKLQLGMSKKAKISIKPSTSYEIPRFFSDDPTIASVSSSGIVTGNKIGKTIIRVSIGNGKDAHCRIDVKDNKNKTENINTTTETDEVAIPTPTPVPTSEPDISSSDSQQNTKKQKHKKQKVIDEFKPFS